MNRLKFAVIFFIIISFFSSQLIIGKFFTGLLKESIDNINELGKLFALYISYQIVCNIIIIVLLGLILNKLIEYVKLQR